MFKKYFIILILTIFTFNIIGCASTETKKESKVKIEVKANQKKKEDVKKSTVMKEQAEEKKETPKKKVNPHNPFANVQEKKQANPHENMKMSYEQMNQLGCKAIEAGDYKTAEKYFMTILSTYNKNDALATYNLSCTYSLMGEKEKALRLLRRSMDLGYMNLEQIKKDGDLANIRNEEEYQNILNSAQNKIDKQNEEQVKMKHELEVESKRITKLIVGIEKELEKVRDVKFNTPLKIQVITKKQGEMMGYTNIRGLYVDKQTPLYIIKPENAKDESRYEGVWIHETEHALQDQNFDLKKLHSKAENTDQSLAIQALIEGEANYLMVLVLLDRNPDNKMMQGFLDMDQPIEKRQVFSYFVGGAFSRYLKELGGWDKVNEAFTTKVPLSTEQIIHPEKFVAYEAPINVDMSKSPLMSDDCEIKGQDTMGEYRIIQILLNAKFDKADVMKASEGWGGDSYVIAQVSGSEIFAWKSVWDSENDAKEFYELYNKYLANNYGMANAENNVNYYSKDKSSSAFWIEGNNVYLIETNLPDNKIKEYARTW